MRVRLVLAVISVASTVAACALDEVGLMMDMSDATADVVDAHPIDAPIDVPQACSTLDASACFDGALPDGWTFAAVASSDQPCPSSAYLPSSYLYAPTPTSGACSCSCATLGNYTCEGPFTAGGNNGGCNQGSVAFDAGPDGCVDTNWSGDHHATATWQPTANGSPTCNAMMIGDGGWSASTATACTPSCEAFDFCALASPFLRCIVSSTSTVCPTQGPFTEKQPSLGTASNVDVTCEKCGCSVSPPSTCDASVVAHDMNGCMGNAYAIDNTCQDTHNNVLSLSYVATTIAPTCIPDGGGGTATFATSATVCCIP